MDFRQIFDTCDIAMIDHFVESKFEEDLNLEFKGVATNDLSHANDRKNLGKEIGAFANSAGGIIVWGVDARTGDDGIDRAQKKKPDRRSQIAAALEDEELADLLEEMPEEDQVRLLAGLSRSARPTSSRRWSPTTPRTCWPRCRPSSASGC